MPRDGTATRTRILDAAQTLMERNGVTGTSVDQILDGAHTSKGAFFHHFDSKRELTAVLPVPSPCRPDIPRRLVRGLTLAPVCIC